MFARATLFEIDTLRISLDDALELFKQVVLPALRDQSGYKGLLVMRTPEGKGMLVSLWETEHDAEAGIESGYYSEQVSKFLMFTRQAPGREHYEVVYDEVGARAGALSGDAASA
jgi:heme-degrading monooxygenase HmoA